MLLLFTATASFASTTSQHLYTAINNASNCYSFSIARYYRRKSLRESSKVTCYFLSLFGIVIRLKVEEVSRRNRIACNCNFFQKKYIFFLYDLFYALFVILILYFFIFPFDCYILEYVIFLKVLLLVLVYKTYTEYLMYSR